MTNNFRAVSLSHTNPPLHVREAFALNQDQLKNFSGIVKDKFQPSDLLVISTCNRTELYYVSDTNIDLELIKALSAEKGFIDYSLYAPFFVSHSGIDAVERLFEVSSGLQSKVVGDLQIPNQIKQSYQLAADMDLAGPFLHRLMHTIFFTNKRIAQETSFRDGAASVTYVAVTLAEELIIPLKNPKVLVLGLGEIGVDVVKYLSDREFKNVTLVTRTLAKAQDLANIHGFEAMDIIDLKKAVATADVVISSIRMDDPLITKSLLNGTMAMGFKYLIDLAVPRSVENNVEEIPGVLLYNIDTLQAKADEALSQRMLAIPDVKAIIADALEGFNDWSKEVMVSPTINKLKLALDQIRKEEMARFNKNLSQQEADKIEKITSNIIQKILKQPVIQLKAACKRGEAEGMIEAINELFDLEKYGNSQNIEA